MRTGLALGLGVLGLCGLLVTRAQGQATAVDISYSPIGGSVVTVGSTFDVSVLAQIIDPSSADSGVFVFSQDFTATNLFPGTSPAFSIVSVSRPGTDDAAYGGSDGTESTSSSGDLLDSGIYGGYDDDTVAVAAPATLYTVTLEAIAPGAISISDGASTAGGYFTNDPADGFELYDFSNPSADYPAGPVITAVSAPEPTTGLITVVASVALARRRRRLGGHV